MKKYDLSKIMKRAWELVKKAGMTISSGLKKAWEEAKMAEKTLKEKIMDELKDIVSDAADVYNYEITEKDWQNYGKDRTYYAVIETRRCSKHYVKYDFGYVDNKTGEYVPGKKDAFGIYGLSGSRRTGR